MDDLRELYQEVILDHNRSPHNFGALEDATHFANGFNPLCGDELKVYVRLVNDIIEDISFEGSGCAISKASSSLMTDSVKGKTLDEAKTIFDAFHQVVTGKIDASDELGKLIVLIGVKNFPMRVKCATLCWHTLNGALEDKDSITTE